MIFAVLCSFEGLTREGVPHGKGVLVVGNGAGGGFKTPSQGDRHAYFVDCAQHMHVCRCL